MLTLYGSFYTRLQQEGITSKRYAPSEVPLDRVIRLVLSPHFSHGMLPGDLPRHPADEPSSQDLVASEADWISVQVFKEEEVDMDEVESMLSGPVEDDSEPGKAPEDTLTQINPEAESQ